MTDKFKVGDLVTYINGYGVKMPEKTVVGTDHSVGEEPRYFLAPTDSPWYSIRESQLILDDDDPVVCVEAGHQIRCTNFDSEQWFLVGTSRQIFRTTELARQYARDNPKS